MSVFELNEPDFDHEAIASRIQARLAMIGLRSEVNGPWVILNDPCCLLALEATSEALMASEVLLSAGYPSLLFDRFQARLRGEQ